MLLNMLNFSCGQLPTVRSDNEMVWEALLCAIRSARLSTLEMS